jgi:hypothetical protein
MNARLLRGFAVLASHAFCRSQAARVLLSYDCPVMALAVARASLLAVGIAMLANPAVGSPITYTFTGEQELAGRFVLNDEANWVINAIPGGEASGVLSSPDQVMWGTLGPYAFTGTATLFVHINSLDGIFDHWIVRSVITSSTGGPLSMTNLNLFNYGHPREISLTPPPTPLKPDRFLFSYSPAFSDGSAWGAPLLTLTKVPESPSIAVWLIAFGFLAAARFFTRSPDQTKPL